MYVIVLYLISYFINKALFKKYMKIKSAFFSRKFVSHMIVLYIVFVCTVEFYCNVNERHFRLYSPDGGAAPANGRVPNTTGADTD